MFEVLVMSAALALPTQDSSNKPWVVPVNKNVKGNSLKAKSKRLRCKANPRFGIERRWGFSDRAKLAGRCGTTHFKKINTVHTRHGHHPSASKAMDFMTNTAGSCSVDRKEGDHLFKYFRKNWGKFGVRYIIWENKYYVSKRSGGRYMSRPGCTHGHFDHLHVAFR